MRRNGDHGRFGSNGTRRRSMRSSRDSREATNPVPAVGIAWRAADLSKGVRSGSLELPHRPFASIRMRIGSTTKHLPVSPYLLLCEEGRRDSMTPLANSCLD